MSGYLLAFEIISVHLVVVLIGAAYLARAKHAARPAGEAHVARNVSQTLDYLLKERDELLAQPVGLTHYLVVGAVLFVCGVVCMATKRNILAC